MEFASQRSPVSSSTPSRGSNIPEHVKNLEAERGGRGGEGGSLLLGPSLMGTEKHRVLVCVCAWGRGD